MKYLLTINIFSILILYVYSNTTVNILVVLISSPGIAETASKNLDNNAKRSVAPLNICHLQPKQGSGSDKVRRYSYDQKSNTCEAFNYSGSNGNENRFKTFDLCESVCKKHDNQPNASALNIVLDKCLRQKAPGPCSKNLTGFFYNSTTSKCEKNGCKENDNHFETLELCESTCKQSASNTSIIILPHILDYQSLQHRSNNSKNLQKKSYNESEIESRFDFAKDICKQPKSPRPCNDYFIRYFYNSKTNKCEIFIYNGCGGNNNRFKKMESCESACIHLNSSSQSQISITPINRCHYPQEQGTGTDHVQQYFYNIKSNKCEEFIYKGHGGNDNRFSSIELCADICKNGHNEINSANIILPVQCHQPKSVGRPCTDGQPKYFYNSNANECEIFLYGGCKGNGNGFDSFELCESLCIHSDSAITEPDLDNIALQNQCLLPKLVGPCTDGQRKYFYNLETTECEQFLYGGCKGNGNRFDSSQLCELACKPRGTLTKQPDIEIPLHPQCYQAKLVGPCTNGGPKYIYNSITNECEIFLYGGCKGNGNAFDSFELCELFCIEWNTAMRNPDLYTALQNQCLLPKLVGPCTDGQQKYFYNPETNECEQFLYGGCKGNGNRFDTSQICELACKPRNTLTKQVDIEMHPECYQPKLVGPCTHSQRKYFFNPMTKKCEIFLYGGCMGNDNRFDSINICMKTCKNFMHI